MEAAMPKLLTAIGLLTLFGSASAALAVEDGPEVRRLGRTVTQCRDRVVNAVISTKYAANHRDRAWTVLEFAVMAGSGKPVVIAREDVSLVAEDGAVMPLPSQKAMAEGLPDVRKVLQTARIMSDPITGYFPFAQHEHRLKFFTVPGQSIVFDEEVVSNTRMVRGWLFFRSPAGKWGGLYELVIKNQDLTVKIPFRLPPHDFPDKEGDPKIVPW
jgi:hypothetical protein